MKEGIDAPMPFSWFFSEPSKVNDQFEVLPVAKEQHSRDFLPLLQKYNRLVLPTRIELVFHPYQGCVIPLYYESLVQPPGIEPGSTVLQTAAMTTSARAAILVLRDRFELPTSSL